MRPLDGILVLDFSTLLPGPMATLMLAEAGAEVVKIERPGSGDEMRRYDPAWGRDSINFALLNRGKKSLALDLKDPAARTRLRPLLERADVIVEQFRPGVMARLGLDYAQVRTLNPRVIYCSVTGYGQTGPKADVAAHDLNYIAETGLLSLSLGDPARPVVPPALIADIAGGAYPAVINVLLALQERARTGRGRHLDVAMTDNLFPFLYWALGNGQAAGAWPGNGTDLVTGGTPRYHLYPTRDGRVVAAAPIEQKFWDAFCGLIGLEERYRDDARDPAATLARVRDILAGEDAATWAARFSGQDCCCTVVVGVREAMEDPHFRSRGLFAHVLSGAGGESLAALPVAIDPGFRPEAGTPLAAPDLGEHTEAYLGDDPVRP
ncbi:Acetyl-CoA:oxalate CoA-transferase [Methylobacterium crusticola]|uniref:Acetyl-CoA:oxalate CoA-transferase n=1 Tax=Methylobacterium crusticola TaxID=1697972 RepID=A0ABQ4R8I2_9HYPH|nr:CaiB/BaiF CoA-transferase family protein [Methylobacterium crusticola]GJD53104.1 Acetyl-CoA:oxalate CoA-transferase [Methylobacterium crusticola]